MDGIGWMEWDEMGIDGTEWDWTGQDGARWDGMDGMGMDRMR